MIVSTTHFKPSGVINAIKFALMVPSVRKQMNGITGLEDFALRGFRTMTLWRSVDDLNAFYRKGAHLDAMKRSGTLGTTRSTRWETDALPSWNEAIKRLDAEKPL